MIEIRCEGVGQVFEGRTVLDNLTCRVQGGQVTAVAGANGSGKSTLLRLAARLMLPTRGRVETLHEGTAVCGAAYRAMLGMATPEMELYMRLTVRENLTFLLGVRGAPHEEAVLHDLLERVGLSPEVLSRPAGQLSTGMRQRVRLAALFGSDADVWLLDEPGLALDDAGRVLLTNEVRRAAQRGCLVLWATNDHAEREAADACIDL